MWVDRKKFEEMQAAAHALLQSLEEMKQRPFLISVERADRENVFTFSRNGEVYQIRTYSTISDNLPEWKEKLLR